MSIWVISHDFRARRGPAADARMREHADVEVQGPMVIGRVSQWDHGTSSISFLGALPKYPLYWRLLDLY